MKVGDRRRRWVWALACAALSPVSLIAAPVQAKKCPGDSVRVGTACVDTYEASVWAIPPAAPGGGSTNGLIKKVQKGTATLASLTAGGATQYGTTVNDYPCAANGNDCTNAIYAVSIPGVIPSHHDVSWFQAAQACANSLVRGGRFESGDGIRAGLYAVAGDIPPTGGIGHMGFRCAREP